MLKLPKNLDFQGYLTLSYLGTVAVGMMFDHHYYANFAIDIFEYSDILDFLLTPARNLEVVLFVVATLGIVYLLFRLDNIWEDRFPKSYKLLNFSKWQKKSKPLLYSVSVVLYLLIAASLYGEQKYERFLNDPTPVSLTFEGGNRTVSGNLIGKNKDYLFLQTPDSTIKAIPINADVQEIVIAQPSSDTP